jgi:NADH-quinone oxidoreductase subunit N
MIQSVQLSWQEAGFPSLLLGVAMACIFVGLAFSISAAPFHGWSAEVYQAAPVPAAAFLATSLKVAAFAVFLRIFGYGMAGSSKEWSLLIWAAAALTMFIGTLGALRQTNVKRLMAYSTVMHTGFVLVALTANSETGIVAALFYLVVYSFASIGAFAVISHLSGRGEHHVYLDEYHGLASREPLLAACLTVFLLSLIGIPITGGFLARFYVLQSAMRSGHEWLVILAVLNSAVAFYCYLRIVIAMYTETSRPLISLQRPAAATRGLLAVCVIATVLLGVAPHSLLRMAARAARWIFLPAAIGS